MENVSGTLAEPSKNYIITLAECSGNVFGKRYSENITRTFRKYLLQQNNNNVYFINFYLQYYIHEIDLLAMLWLGDCWHL